MISIDEQYWYWLSNLQPHDQIQHYIEVAQTLDKEVGRQLRTPLQAASILAGAECCTAISTHGSGNLYMSLWNAHEAHMEADEGLASELWPLIVYLAQHADPYGNATTLR